MSADSAIPESLHRVLKRKTEDRWSGSISLSLKDGRIIAYEIAERFRVESVVSGQPAPHSNR